MTFMTLSNDMFIAISVFVVAIVTVLYLIKPTVRQITVAYLPLWEHVLGALPGHRHLNRPLRRPISWLIQLLLGLLLVLAFASPQCKKNTPENALHIVIIDNSTSMMVSDMPGNQTRLAHAKELGISHLKQFINQAPIMIVAFNDTIEQRTNFTNDRHAAMRAIDSIEETNKSANWKELVDFLNIYAEHYDKIRAIILSDATSFSEQDLPRLSSNIQLQHYSLGSAIANIGIQSLGARRYPMNRYDYEVSLEVISSHNETVRCKMDIYADKRLLMSRSLTINPHSSTRTTFSDISAQGSTVSAHIRFDEFCPADNFAIDNQASTSVPTIHQTTVQLVTQTNLYMEAMLLSNPYITTTIITPQDYDPQRRYDITIFDNITLPKPHSGAVIYFAPEGQFSPWHQGKPVNDPIITDHDKQHPLFRWMQFRHFNIGRIVPLYPDANDQVLARSFDHSVVVLRHQDDQMMLGIAFALQHSDFALRVGFPVFLLNALDFLTPFNTPSFEQLPFHRLDIDNNMVPNETPWTVSVDSTTKGAVKTNSQLWWWLVVTFLAASLGEWWLFTRQRTV